ncbi:MAG: hypothetical protein RR854_00420 [Muribaculaceae bacterium]
MEKLFSNKQLDKAINDLPNNKCAKSFNGLSIEEQKYNDAIYRHLEGKGVAKIQEAGGHVMCASLTDYGLSLKFDGGFEGQKNEDNKKLFIKFKFDIISVIVGTIVGYILGAITVLSVK